MRSLACAVAIVALSGCLSDFEPADATFACSGDEDCASGWRCVDPGTGPICARQISTGGDTGDGFSGDTRVPGDTADGDADLVDTGITFVTEGDQIVQVGGTGKRYFVSAEPMSQDEAVSFCQGLGAGGFTWSLARNQELSALSRCCKTRPEPAERCTTVNVCVLDGPCVAVDECRGCGTPPSGQSCWWDPSFEAPCDIYWARPVSACGVAFDFRTSELTVGSDVARAGAICTAAP